jgi:hypothetical protein
MKRAREKTWRFSWHLAHGDARTPPVCPAVGFPPTTPSGIPANNPQWDSRQQPPPVGLPSLLHMHTVKASCLCGDIITCSSMLPRCNLPCFTIALLLLALALLLWSTCSVGAPPPLRARVFHLPAYEPSPTAACSHIPAVVQHCAGNCSCDQLLDAYDDGLARLVMVAPWRAMGGPRCLSSD